MAPTKNPLVRLHHIRDEIRQIIAALIGTTREDFERDYLKRRAAQHALLIVSEAVRALPDELLKAHPHIEWGQIRAIGNRLRHEYERIDPAVIWTVILRDLPDLAAVVEALLAGQDQDQADCASDMHDGSS